MREIHLVQPEDAQAMAELRAAAFSIPATPDRMKLFNFEMPGVYEDGKLQAIIGIRPYECRWDKTYLPALGISSVATMPLARRGGMIRDLFGELDRLSVERGWAFGLLYPFSYMYYRQFGYEQILPRFSLTVPFDALGSFPRNADGELYDGSQKEALLALYHRYADMHNLMARRTDNVHWRAEPGEELEYTYMHRGKDGEFDAYAVIHYQKEAMDVTELVFTSPEALRGIIGILRLFEGQRKVLCFKRLPERSPVWELMREYKACTRGYTNGAMGRVLNTQKLLETHTWPAERGHFTLRVEDPLPGCAGTYEVEYEKGAAQVTRGDGAGGITMEAPALARVLLSGAGYGAEELAWLPGVQVQRPGDAADLARAFPRRSAELTEEF